MVFFKENKKGKNGFNYYFEILILRQIWIVHKFNLFSFTIMVRLILFVQSYKNGDIQKYNISNATK